VSMMGAGLRPHGKPWDQPPYPKMQSAPHFYPDRIGPEPCASHGEASVGECIGQPLSRGCAGKDRQEVDGASPSR